MSSDEGSGVRLFKRGMPSDEGPSEIILAFEGSAIVGLAGVVGAGVAEFCDSSVTTLIFGETLISGFGLVPGSCGVSFTGLSEGEVDADAGSSGFA
jgi:hypothetical protein